MPNIHRLDPIRHATFLSEQRKDPVTRKPFRAGDEIVICAACRSAFSIDSWNYLDGTHDGQTATLAVIEEHPAATTLRGPRVRMEASARPQDRPETPQRDRVPPSGLVPAPRQFDFRTPVVVVALLLLIAWLVSLAKQSAPPQSLPIQTVTPTGIDTMMDPEPSSVPESQENEAAERARVELGLIGEWSNGGSRLTISRGDTGFEAVYRFPDPPPFSRGEAHQTMRGELLPSNELKLTNVHHGKLANPLNYFSGDFDGESTIALSADGTYVTARLHDGRSLVLVRGAASEQVVSPSGEAALDGSKIAEIQTTAGEIVIRFFPDKAPNHVKNFIALAESGFYDGTNFHRVIPGFMIQGGDPFTKSSPASTWGTGGAANTIDAEFNDVHHRRGIVSMARAQGRNTASSQFFICVDEAGFLDGEYTVFGEVIRGMDVVDTIVSAERGERDQPRSPTTVRRVVIRDAGVDDTPVESETNGRGNRTPNTQPQSGSVPNGVSPRTRGEVSPPAVLNRTEPRYTEVARKARIAGVVVLECVIDEYGDVRSVRILKGLPLGLDKAAADTVATWKFRPGTIDGQPVETVFNLTVNFKLDR